jgi:DNA-binding transcriptional regulator LsrR (DeoR family)
LTVKYEREIRSLIEIINGHLCVIPFKQLRQVRGCWIAAGTPKKAAALHHCLTSDLRINALCVDSELAEELLKLS